MTRSPLGLISFGSLALAALAACSAPTPSVAPNPVAYVRPAPSPPFAPGASADRKGLAPYVAVTISPPGGSAAAPPPAVPPPFGPPPVVTVPAYSAPVYSPGGTRSGG